MEVLYDFSLVRKEKREIYLSKVTSVSKRKKNAFNACPGSGNKCTTVFLPSTCLSVVLDNESFMYLNFMGVYSGLSMDQSSDRNLSAYQRKLAFYSIYSIYLGRCRNLDVFDTGK